ncbi:MAG: glycerol-3-phosphate 1-O-acyltransferase PlsY [Endomicrobium sp.]|jgi:glycerol-3-phosphate acyltransferase PlsY|nr:glycerol-3-phosphate 1-O-acyltransferase PlsY [Endomicrobium sp.]
MTILIKILYVALAYLCGAISFAYIIAKRFGKVDIRSVGSGNPGAANVFRTVGKGPGILTFVADALKGFISVYFAIFIENSFFYSLAVSASVMLGHMFTIFLKFKGGRGVATGLGIFLALMPVPSLMAVFVFSLVLLLSGYVSLSSICAALSLPIASYFLGYATVKSMTFTFIITFFVICRHKTNIKKLIKGCENKFK